MMRKDKHQRQEPKDKYRVKNWSAYNTGLIARGDVTIWMERDMWQRNTGGGAAKCGRPCVHADALIQMLLRLKQVFRLPLRGKCQRNPYPARSLQIDDLTQQPRRDAPLLTVTQ
jgi:hypothetical protein